MLCLFVHLQCARVQEDNDGSADGEIATILQPSSISNNMFDKLTKYIDDNIRLFRVSKVAVITGAFFTHFYNNSIHHGW